MRHASRENRRGSQAGFSLIELMVVVGLIGLLAALSFPQIGRYFRLYRIRGAQQQVAGAIQQARNRAISKNVNNGVSLVIQDQSTYWIHVEDDQSTARTTQPMALTFAAPNVQQSTAGVLPDGVRFALSAAECPTSVLASLNLTGTYTPNAGFFRFNRLGSWCGVGCTTLTTTPAPANLMMNGAAGSFLCLYQPATGLSRGIVVSPGGRIQTQR